MLHGWKINLTILLSLTLGGIGFYIDELTKVDVQTYVALALSLLLGGKRVDAMGTIKGHPNQSKILGKVNIVAIGTALGSYFLGVVSYEVMSYSIIAGMGVIGFDHKLQKVDAYYEKHAEITEANLINDIIDAGGVYDDTETTQDEWDELTSYVANKQRNGKNESIR